MCLNVFLTGLKEPLGSTIRAMRPKSLTEAFNYCLSEQNTYYATNLQSSKPFDNNKKPLTKTRSSIPNFNFKPIPQRPNFVPPQPQSFYTPHYQRFNQPRFQNNFRPNFSNQQVNSTRSSSTLRNRPDPMNTSSGNTSLRPFKPSFQPHNIFRPNNQSLKFISEELFNLESEYNLVRDMSFQDDTTRERNQHSKHEHSFNNVKNYLQNLDEFHQQDQKVRNEIDDTNFP